MVCLAMVGLFCVQRLDIMLLGGVVFFALGVNAGISAKYLARGLRLVWILSLFTLVFNAFLTPGEALWQLGSLTLTWEGLARGSAMAMRFFLLVLLTSLLSLTTPPIILTDAIERVLLPLKYVGVPTQELALVSTIALRFVPTLAQETDSIMKAQLARGACLDRGPWHRRGKALVSVIVPLFVSAFRYADDLAQAMDARCYRGGVGRTRLHELRLRGADFLALGIGVVFIITLIMGDRLLG